KSGNKSQNSLGSSDYWIVKTDKDGMYQWDKRFGGDGTEELRAVIQTNDGGLLLAGKSDSGVSGDRTQPSQGGTDFWLIKVALETTPMVAARAATWVEEPVKEATLEQLQAYPNPFKEKVTVSFTLPQSQKATVKIYDSQGREVSTLYQGEVEANQKYQVEWKAGNKAAGMYFLHLQTPTIRRQSKLLLTK
ncbi:MAG: T9SS type A sorting domain-containing protein, partial [Bacteroidota bacterium]|nr:T9SS type A sorting domain-containing protein [Bacteroidota bacterium]